MGFLPVFVLFVTFLCCSHTSAMTSTLPMAEFLHCSILCKSKPGACSHQWVMFTCSHTHQAFRFPLLLLPPQLALTRTPRVSVELHCSGLSLGQGTLCLWNSCTLCLSPVTLLKDIYPSFHVEALVQLGSRKGKVWLAVNCLSWTVAEDFSRDNWLWLKEKRPCVTALEVPEEKRHSLKLKEGDCKQAERMSCFPCLLQPLQMS